jgi:hypothetical protein
LDFILYPAVSFSPGQVIGTSNLQTTMKSTLLFLLFSALVLTSYSQTELINQHDQIGKKNGKWILYYTAQWEPVSDSSKALFYCYTYYDHGKILFPNPSWGTPKGRLLDSTSSVSRLGKIKLLDGKYTWFDSKGKMTSIHVYSKGEPIWCKEFYPSGAVRLYCDFTKKCEGQPHSWCLYTYEENGTLLLVSPVCNDNSGNWPLVR